MALVVVKQESLQFCLTSFSACRPGEQSEDGDKSLPRPWTQRNLISIFGQSEVKLRMCLRDTGESAIISLGSLSLEAKKNREVRALPTTSNHHALSATTGSETNDSKTATAERYSQTIDPEAA